MFLLTLQDLPEENFILEHLVDAMKQFPDKLLLVRPHPLAMHKRLKRLLCEVQNVIVMRELKLRDLLEACELFFTTTSTTSFDAILLDRPVVILNPASRLYPYAFIDEGAAIEVRQVWKIGATVRKVLSNREVRESLATARRNVIDRYGPSMGLSSSEFIHDWLVAESHRRPVFASYGLL